MPAQGIALCSNKHRHTGQYPQDVGQDDKCLSAWVRTLPRVGTASLECLLPPVDHEKSLAPFKKLDRAIF